MSVNSFWLVVVQLVLEQCNILLQLVNSDSRRVIPLIFTQLSLSDLIISDWSHKVPFVTYYFKCLSILISAFIFCPSVQHFFCHFIRKLLLHVCVSLLYTQGSDTRIHNGEKLTKF